MANDQLKAGDSGRSKFDDYTNPSEETRHALVHEFAGALQANYSKIDRDHNDDIDEKEIAAFGQTSPENKKLADFLTNNLRGIAELDDMHALSRRDTEMLMRYSGTKEETDTELNTARDESFSKFRKAVLTGGIAGNLVGLCVGGPPGMLPGFGIGAATGAVAGLIDGGTHYWTQSHATSKVQNLHI
jgi:hypothetical protein